VLPDILGYIDRDDQGPILMGFTFLNNSGIDRALFDIACMQRRTRRTDGLRFNDFFVSIQVYQLPSQ
jgi:hypothetical protein